MPKKRTGGALFDATVQPVYFIASSVGTLHIASEVNSHLLVAVNELENKASLEALDKIIDGGGKVFLDSGIFNLTNKHARAHDVPMDVALSLAPNEIDGFDRLWDRYCELVQRYSDRLWGFIELDQGGAVNKRKTRARIEKETGLVPIPVYHPFNDGWDYFDELCNEYDRVCLGNVVQAEAATRKRLMHTMRERQRELHPDTWVHVLGFTPNEWVHSIPWYGSCDSSSWLTNIRWSDSHKSHSMCKHVGTFTSGMRYRYGSELTELDGTHRAYLFAAAQGGTFLERCWSAAMEDRRQSL